MSRSSDSASLPRARAQRFFLVPTVLAVLCAVLTQVAVAAADPPVVADGPIPGGPVVVPDGTTFTVLDLQLDLADRRGIARVETTPTETKVHLDNTVLFDQDSAAVRPVAAGRLTEVARQLRSLGPGSISVTGYTDDLGSAAHGLSLSRRRAGAVASRLVSVLPAADFPLTVRGRGEADPEVPNDSEAHRRMNRRVIIDYRPR